MSRRPDLLRYGSRNPDFAFPCPACKANAYHACVKADGMPFAVKNATHKERAAWRVKAIDMKVSFLEDIKAVYEKHGLSLSHEDKHGAFVITNENNLENFEWLQGASNRIKLEAK